MRLGEHDLKSNPDCYSPTECVPPVKDFRVIKRIVHESYDANDRDKKHDIALLRLATKVPYGCKYTISKISKTKPNFLIFFEFCTIF